MTEVLPTTDQAPPPSPGDRVPDAKAREVSSRATTLLEDDQDVLYAFSLMLSGRRMYQVGRFVLSERLPKLKLSDEDRELVEQFLVQTAVSESNKPFDTTQLVNVVQGQCVPALAVFRDSQLEKQEARERELARDRETLRRQQTIPLPFTHERDGQPCLHRGESLVLVGKKPVLDACFEEATKLAVHHKLNVVRLVSDSLHEPSFQFTVIDAADWKGCADSRRNLTMTLKAHLDGKQLDLLIVDDLSYADTSMGYTSRKRAKRAAVAHKRIRAAAEEFGFALLAGVEFDDPSPQADVAAPVWNELRDFTKVRPVNCYSLPDDDQHYELRLGADAGRVLVARQSVRNLHELASYDGNGTSSQGTDAGGAGSPAGAGSAATSPDCAGTCGSCCPAGEVQEGQQAACCDESTACGGAGDPPTQEAGPADSAGAG